eukprot:m.55260 g.55260  ORF g.55260 m.55260 type:complete len:864 (-) comp11472_c2_seq1:646-3237(-)
MAEYEVDPKDVPAAVPDGPALALSANAMVAEGRAPAPGEEEDESEWVPSARGRRTPRKTSESTRSKNWRKDKKQRTRSKGASESSDSTDKPTQAQKQGDAPAAAPAKATASSSAASSSSDKPIIKSSGGAVWGKPAADEAEKTSTTAATKVATKEPATASKTKVATATRARKQDASKQSATKSAEPATSADSEVAPSSSSDAPASPSRAAKAWKTTKAASDASSTDPDLWPSLEQSASTPAKPVKKGFVDEQPKAKLKTPLPDAMPVYQHKEGKSGRGRRSNASHGKRQPRQRSSDKPRRKEQPQQAAAAATDVLSSASSDFVKFAQMCGLGPKPDQVLSTIEYYFSKDNILRDLHLRNLMRKDGSVLIGDLMNFQRLVEAVGFSPTPAASVIENALRKSQVVVVEGNAVRRRDGFGGSLPHFQLSADAAEFVPSFAQPTAADDGEDNDEANQTIHDIDETPRRKPAKEEVGAAAPAEEQDGETLDFDFDEDLSGQPGQEDLRLRFDTDADEQGPIDLDALQVIYSDYGSPATSRRSRSASRDRQLGQEWPRGVEVASSPSSLPRSLGTSDTETRSHRASSLSGQRPVTHSPSGATVSASRPRANSTGAQKQRGSSRGRDRSADQRKAGVKFFPAKEATAGKRGKSYKTKYSKDPVKEGGVGWTFKSAERRGRKDKPGTSASRDSSTDSQSSYQMQNQIGRKLQSERGLREKSYRKFREKALQSRGESTELLSALFRFWSFFLRDHFDKDMYEEFKTLAVEERDGNYRYGMECLYRFYGYGLENNFRLNLYHEFEALALEDYEQGNLYGLEKLWALFKYRTGPVPKDVPSPRAREILAEYQVVDDFRTGSQPASRVGSLQRDI